jgi:CRP-like cAMP-binding protein
LPEALHLLGPALIQTNCFMQIAGTGLRMRFKDFEQLFQRDEAVRRPVLRYVQFQNLVLSQIAACNRLHEVEERLARWLLMVSDRIGDSELRLTQEFLSQMLGARRSTVTLVAGTLQRGGLIEYSRGDVKILDRDKLESAACECYRITQDALKRLMQPTVVAL